MRARHDITSLGVTAGDFAKDIVRFKIAVIKAGFGSKFDHRRSACQRKTNQPAIVFGGQLEGGQRKRFAGRIGIAFAVHQHSIPAADPDHRQRAFGLEKFGQLAGKAPARQAFGSSLGVEPGQVILVHFADLTVAEALEVRICRLTGGAGQADQHDLARQLAAPFGEIFFLADRSDGNRRTDHAASGGRPGNWNCGHLDATRTDHPGRMRPQVPAKSEPETLGMNRTQPQAAHPGQRPGLGPAIAI